jgi:hypothetical protein
MRVAIDPHDATTAYADLRDNERLTDEVRIHAIERARQLGAEHVEFWRLPYGDGADRMAGFVEVAHVRPKSESGSAEPNARSDESVIGASTQPLSRAG